MTPKESAKSMLPLWSAETLRPGMDVPLPNWYGANRRFKCDTCTLEQVSSGRNFCIMCHIKYSADGSFLSNLPKRQPASAHVSIITTGGLLCDTIAAISTPGALFKDEPRHLSLGDLDPLPRLHVPSGTDAIRKHAITTNSYHEYVLGQQLERIEHKRSEATVKEQLAQLDQQLKQKELKTTCPIEKTSPLKHLRPPAHKIKASSSRTWRMSSPFRAPQAWARRALWQSSHSSCSPSQGHSRH